MLQRCALSGESAYWCKRRRHKLRPIIGGASILPRSYPPCRFSKIFCRRKTAQMCLFQRRALRLHLPNLKNWVIALGHLVLNRSQDCHLGARKPQIGRKPKSRLLAYVRSNPLCTSSLHKFHKCNLSATFFPKPPKELRTEDWPGIEDVPSRVLGPYTSAYSYPLKGGFNLPSDRANHQWGALVLFSHASPGSKRVVYHNEGRCSSV
jgi:hypothetical protein